MLWFWLLAMLCNVGFTYVDLTHGQIWWGVTDMTLAVLAALVAGYLIAEAVYNK